MLFDSAPIVKFTFDRRRAVEMGLVNVRQAALSYALATSVNLVEVSQWGTVRVGERDPKTKRSTGSVQCMAIIPASF